MNLRNKLIGTKDFYKRVLAIVLPMIIQNTVTNVVSLLDNVMVGRLGTLPMSAVAIVNQLIFVFNLCIFGGLAGAGIFSTQYAGVNDHKGIRYCFRAKTVIGIAVVAVSLIIFLCFPEQLIKMYLNEGTSAEDAAVTLKYGLSYLRIMLIGLLPFTVTQIYASSLREIGETKLPMIASIVAIAVNLVFNYLLIYGKLGFPRLNVVGAGIATVLSRFVEAAIVVIAATKRRNKYQFLKSVFRSLYVPRDLCFKIFKKGFPLLINEFLWSLGMAVLLQCYSVRGIEVVAALNIANTINNLFSVVFLTMGNAVAIIVGQHLGANEIEKAKASVWQLITLAVACCIVLGAGMASLAAVIPLIYNTTNTVRELATSFLYIIALFMPIYAFAHNCYFTLRSGGRTIITFLFDSACTWVICVPCAFILARFTGLPILTLYFAVQSLELIKCVIGFVMIKKGLWIRNIIDNKNNV